MNSRIAILPEVFTFTRQLPISGASTTFSVQRSWRPVSGLGYPVMTNRILLQGFCATTGYSPLLALMTTNLTTSRQTGTLGFSQTYSALQSRRVLCPKTRDPHVVLPSGCYPSVASTSVTGVCRSCLLNKASTDYSATFEDSILRSNHTLMGVLPFRGVPTQ